MRVPIRGVGSENRETSPIGDGEDGSGCLRWKFFGETKCLEKPWVLAFSDFDFVDGFLELLLSVRELRRRMAGVGWLGKETLK